mgnify:CR=1 FL=1
MIQTDNLNIASVNELPTPAEIKADHPLTSKAAKTVVAGRSSIESILSRRDSRLLMIVGPCSIHSLDEAVAYAEKLKALADEVEERIVIVMRSYFEKPRTILGWKGLIYDPELNGSGNIDLGLRLSRQIMLKITELGLPTATEVLEPIIPQYITDLLSWAAIGARTAESQTHRQMASGLSMPIGFKNATDGGMKVAVEAIKAAASPHTFIGITSQGVSGIFRTRGNAFGHLVLRGGIHGPNYESEYIAFAREMMRKAGLATNIMIDCSHGNSGKMPSRQIKVMENVVDQRRAGCTDIVGTMLESNLRSGHQAIGHDPSALEPGLSVTDACLGWEETEALIRDVFEQLSDPRRSPPAVRTQ